MGRAMICTIHQPNFFPWYPFFQKMQQADVFVLLTDCQYEKNGYQNRFRLGERWHTMSVNSGLEPIRNKRYVNWHKDWRKIKANVGMYDLSWADDYICEDLVDTNYLIILALRERLKIRTPVFIDTATGKTATERLISICELHNCDQYLSGVSGCNYLDMELFKKKGIEVLFQKEADMVKKHSLEVLLCG
jgi:hypothetical protein